MLQRAASNAYSWWWASHVRTKQSKWLEQNLQDMGEKVEAVLKLIEEDGDSFIKKAEMYYKKRPEFINFVEESYRAYRSLAERYDILSKELQNANKTLASAFPDQYQYELDDDEEDENGPPRMARKLPENPNIPEAPGKFPAKKIKAYIALTSKSKKFTKKGTTKPVVQKSGLTKPEAIQEVDKLQKQILTLQTEKEFAKSSYESGHAKYWKLEEEIEGMQEKISKLQDEFEINQVIEDDEARTLMARSALKSCQETLAQLQEKQEKAASEAKDEREKIKDAREKLMFLKGNDLAETYDMGDLIDEELDGLDGSEELEKLRDQIKEHFDVGSTSSLTVSQMAEKVDELVSKVINLESAVSSQTALIHRLRSETDDLQSKLKRVEDDKVNQIDGKNTVDDKLREMEDKLRDLRDLDRSFEKQNTSLETHFTEAQTNIDTISEKLHNIRLDEEVEESSMFKESGDLKEQLITNEYKSSLSTLEIAQHEEFPKESHPSTFDVAHPQELPKEHMLSSIYLAQPQENADKILVEWVSSNEAQQQEHTTTTTPGADPTGMGYREEYKPHIFDDAAQQEHPNELELWTQPEAFPKPSTFDVVHPQELPKEHMLSNIYLAQPQENADKMDVEWVSSNEAEPQEHIATSTPGADPTGMGYREEYKPHTFDDAAQQEHPNRLELWSFDFSQPQEQPMERSSITIDVVQPQEDDDKRDVELVSYNETQPRQHPHEYKLSIFDRPEQELPKTLESNTLDVAKPQEFPMEDYPNSLYDVGQQEVNNGDEELVISNEVQKRETESMMEDNKLNINSSAKPQEKTIKEEDEPDWQLLFTNGLEGKEKVLLAEYTSTLRNYKQAKKKLGALEKKTEMDFSDIAAQLQDLRSSNANKDEEILSLQQKLYILQKMMDEYGNSKELKRVETRGRNEGPSYSKEDNEIIHFVAKSEDISPVEQKLRADIDEILEENLDFWMRFSASFSQVQIFQRKVEDLQSEIAKLEQEHDTKEGKSPSMKSEIKPLYKHLREIQTSLTVWLENSEKMKDELHSRCAELSNIQDEIEQALNVGAEDEEMKFTSYQAAKFQGEAANMQQENHKVDEELRAGMDHITGLQIEVEHTLARLNEELGFVAKNQSSNEINTRINPRVPLRSFIFGDKPPKKKYSFFSLMHKHRKLQHLKSEKLP